MMPVRRLLPALALMILAACATRPLTPGERAFTATVQGATLDTSTVAVTKGALIAGFPGERKPRPYTTCRERLYPRETTEKVRWTVAGFALRDRLYVSQRKWRDDFLAGYPETLPLANAMFLSHELTHVWQWQNRAETGYSAFRAAAEHGEQDDPYRFELTPGKSFLAYGYEQQAALVEEFVCCRTLDPDGGRTRTLYALLKPEFPGVARRSPAGSVKLPWPEAETRGICRG